MTMRSAEKEIQQLCEHFELQDRTYAICAKRAVEDDAVKGLAAMKQEEAFNAVMQQMAAYRCARCETIYCGGKAECGAADDSLDPASLLCQECAWREAKSDHKCRTHGPSKAIFKCDCCCAIATYDCSGNHYCDSCHKTPSDGLTVRHECRGRVQDRCPLSLPHPPNRPRNHSIRKSGFVVGCAACLGIESHCDMASVSSATIDAF